ncbi:MAG: ABC transporter permease [Clostridiales bacterium]|nr:ABC transporter permease [Clostridiales bacterium]MDY4180338.1 ABC transporter permease [Pseudoflavonifractor sp.]
MNAVLMALDSIREKKARSFLTMLGIIIGVAAVLVLVALVSGYNADITAYYEKLGVNKVNVSVTWYDRTRAVDVYSALYGYGNTTLGDMVEGVSPSASTSLPVKYRSATLESSTVYLGSDQFAVCGNYVLESGRDISEFDIQRRSKVCVLGSYVADSLFPYTDPIGQTVTLGGIPFTVVGTYYQKDGGQEGSMDDMLSVPYSLDRELLQTADVTEITVKVDTSAHVETVLSRLEVYLSGLVSSSVGEYTLENGNSAMSESNEEMTSMSVVLGGIASIALLVGGIGIMNIMLVTVTERTREIGIKKSIGAPRSEIISQFLVEAAILSGMGGLIGIALGFALSLILGKAMYDLILLPNALVTLGSFTFSVVIGILFGIYPAVKASNLQPVDALRAD